MIQQIKKTFDNKIQVKITISNFQKKEGNIYTSQNTEVEIDDEVCKYIFNNENISW